MFCRISASAFGGGYTVLPIFQKELIDNRAWVSDKELSDYYALAQCQPGLILVNTAVLIITPRFGAVASVVACVGILLPPLTIILVITLLLNNFSHLPLIQHAMAGIRVAVAALMVLTSWRLIRSGVKNIISVVIFLTSLVLSILGLINPIFIIIAAALSGIIIGVIKKKGGAA